MRVSVSNYRTEAADIGLACRSVPLDQLGATVAEIAEQVVATSNGSRVAYKDLYRDARAGDIAAGLDYESASTYEIEDTEERLAAFR